MCLNYVEGGSCLIDGRPCLLGDHGNQARNQDRECVRHGVFDVWKTQEGLILISDLGGPCEGVTDCYGLGISLEESTKVGQSHAQSLGARIITTQRKCRKCGTRFWAAAGLGEKIVPDRANGYFCASCLKLTPKAEIDKYWKEIGRTEDKPHIDLSDWCG